MPRRLSALALLAGLLFSWSSDAAGQSATLRIRDALVKHQFEDALDAPGTRDLDEVLTSSDFGASADTFVAAYYLRTELTGELLGPLHVSVFHRQGRRWTHASNFADGGSVLGIQVSARYLALDLHGNPSSGMGLILAAGNLAVIASLRGFNLRLLSDGRILFSANMRHFAPTHQERLMVCNPSTRREVEIFPGVRESGIASRYRQTVLSLYAGLPPEAKQTHEKSVYGPIVDFDRGITHVAEDSRGGRVAFAVHYDSDRLGEKAPRLQTLAACDRRRADDWTCTERELEDVAREHALTLKRQPDGRVDQGDVDRLIQLLLKTTR